MTNKDLVQHIKSARNQAYKDSLFCGVKLLKVSLMWTIIIAVLITYFF